jgi:glycosyltransferase involved in cell wall biosynthesis
VVCHNVLPHESRPADGLLTRLLLRRAGSALTHSEEEAARARALAPAAQVTVARLAPHLPAAAPVLHRSDHAGGSQDAERYGLLRSAPCRLLFFGIVRPYKGLDVLLRALARAPDHVMLTVAGEFWGRTEAEARALVAQLGLTGRVRLRPGYVAADQIPGLFAEADALVLPYRTATSSQNPWLGFAYGVPVIATRAGTLADLVRDGVDGLICEPDDEDDLLRALKRISAPGEAARLRSAVRPADPDGYWDAYLATLLSLTAPPAREPPGLEGLEPMPR